MIERVYLDNILSFVNFEWKPGSLVVALGPNGAGKTSLITTLAAVQAFVTGDISSGEAFPAGTLTRWDTRQQQTVELDVRVPAGLCRYRLVVEHKEKPKRRVEVVEERLTMGELTLVEVKSGVLALFETPEEQLAVRFQTRTDRSGIGSITPSSTDTAIAAFKDAVSELWFLRPDPRTMKARLADRKATDEDWLDGDLSNFADWYLRLLATKPGTMFKALQELGMVIPGLVELHEKGGSLRTRFEIDGVTQSFSFDELSDGQRALIALYVLRHVIGVPGRLIVLDEPDNYVSLEEIQPWLRSLERAAFRSGGPQVWLVSHHPEVLNLLAVEFGWRFFRDGLGPTRVEKFQPIDGIQPAEAVARGWTGEPS